MYSELKQVRINHNLTQRECSDYLNIPIKTLRNWEQGVRSPSKGVLDIILDKLINYNREKETIYSEDSGILSFSQIKVKVKEVSSQYNIKKVYLFGSYAKGLSNELSDIDLYIESDISGIDYFGVAEDFRENLNKGVDLLSNITVIKDSNVYNEIRKTGILIYER